MNKRQRIRTLALSIGLGVGMRVALAIAQGFWFPDSADYDALARTVFSAASYQVNNLFASRMPGYPVFLAVIYALFGAPFPGHISVPVMVVQGLLGGVTIWLTYLIGRRINLRVALTAAFLAALDPLSLGFSATMLTEACFTTILMLALWLALWLIEEPARRFNWLWLGLLWGLSVYFRASALWCIVPLAGWVAWMQIKRSTNKATAKILTGAALTILFAGLTLVPWCTRNYQIFHSGFFRLTTLEGISLYEAVYPQADGSPQQHLIKPPPDMQQLNEAQMNDEWSRRAWGYVFSDPARMVRLAILKIGRTWSPWFNTNEIHSRILFWGMTLFYVPLFLAAIFGIFTRAMPKHIKGLLLVPILYFTLVHALYLGSVRYRVPLMPVVCIFAASGIVSLWQGIADKRQPPETV